MEQTVYRTCPLCEATCGLAIVTDGDAVVSIRGDGEDVFSRGFLCPKGYSLKALHEDPDRLRAPMLRRPDGSFEACSWEDAFAVIEERLPGVLADGGRDAVAAYLGNPTAHSLSALIYGRVLLKALGTRNVFSASTVDQMPKHVSAGRMFGSPFAIPVPDVDRTDFLLILGANPLVSNGSLLTAPDMRGRLRRIRERGGTVVVVDPRRTRTAEAADRHLAIRPGTDALLLLALAHVIVSEDLGGPGERLAAILDGLDEVRELALGFAPEDVAGACGIPAPEIRTLARDLAAAPSAAVYGRIGTCTQEFGTLASWLVDVVNVLTGNLDRPGGAMFPRPAAALDGARRPMRFGRWQSRVRGFDETLGELPVACLAEEIETPGDGRVRTLITIAGNPVLSTPDGARLARAFESLDFMVSLDVYLNETTRHADVILPAPSPLEHSHYDLALYGFHARNVANYSPPVFERPDVLPDEWETLLRLTGVAAGLGAGADIEALDDLVAGEQARREVAAEGSIVAGRDPAELVAELAPRRGPERLLDFMLRTGPYGDGFGARSDGLTLAALEAAPHGIDLGALEPALPGRLRTTSGRIDLAPAPFVADVERLRARLAEPDEAGVVLIGRRQLRSNNSWMHNLPLLVRGRDRCTLQVHPDDARRFGLADGERARVKSATGEVEVPVEETDAIRPGVVSIPHGWGHDAPGARLGVAAEHAGANSNLLADAGAVDPLSGNAVLCGIPVELAPARAPAAVAPA